MAKLFYATGPSVFPTDRYLIGHESYMQCDQKKKVAKSLSKLPKNDFTRKNKDFDTYTKIAHECGRFWQNNCCQGV